MAYRSSAATPDAVGVLRCNLEPSRGQVETVHEVQRLINTRCYKLQAIAPSTTRTIQLCKKWVAIRYLIIENGATGRQNRLRAILESSDTLKRETDNRVRLSFVSLCSGFHRPASFDLPVLAFLLGFIRHFVSIAVWVYSVQEIADAINHPACGLFGKRGTEQAAERALGGALVANLRATQLPFVQCQSDSYICDFFYK